MKKRLITAALLTVLITGCGKTEHDTVSEIRKTYCDVPPATVAAVSAQTTSATTAVRTDKALSVTSVSLTSASTAASTDRTEVTVESSAEWEQPQTEAEQTVSSETVNEEEAQYDIFFGILIDEDCSDFEDPPSHDLP